MNFDWLKLPHDLPQPITMLYFKVELLPVWQDWATYWTLGNFSKPLATINLPKSPTFLGNFCKDVKIFYFYSEIILGQIL